MQYLSNTKMKNKFNTQTHAHTQRNLFASKRFKYLLVFYRFYTDTYNSVSDKMDETPGPH